MKTVTILLGWNFPRLVAPFVHVRTPWKTRLGTQSDMLELAAQPCPTAQQDRSQATVLGETVQLRPTVCREASRVPRRQGQVLFGHDPRKINEIFDFVDVRQNGLMEVNNIIINQRVIRQKSRRSTRPKLYLGLEGRLKMSRKYHRRGGGRMDT